MKVAVLGAGSWGTALASLLGKGGHRVELWGRNREILAAISSVRENPKYLPGVRISRSVDVSEEMPRALLGADLVVFTVPSHALREVARTAAADIARGSLVVSAAKGLEPGTSLRMSQVLIAERAGTAETVVALAGPSHAEEVGRDLPTAVVAASAGEAAARAVQEAFRGPSFRVYTNPDLLGVELAVSLKNVIAIAAGISEGLGLGDNAFGTLVTRGLAEMARLGLALGAKAETFAGLAGVGDLVTTCASRHSRNRRVGIEIAKGKSLDEVLAGMVMVAEGVKTTKAALGLAGEAGVELPITEQVGRVLYQDVAPKDAMRALMEREPRSEKW